MLDLADWKNTGKYFEFKGFPIFYRASGPRSRFVLCLHGFPTASFDYRKVWQPISERFQLIAPDLIGYGFSAKPYDLDYTTFLQADVVEALLNHLQVQKVHILAHDSTEIEPSRSSLSDWSALMSRAKTFVPMPLM